MQGIARDGGGEDAGDDVAGNRDGRLAAVMVGIVNAVGSHDMR